MPGATPSGYPYPIGTDRIMDGDDVIAALAAKIEQQLGVAWSTRVSVTVTALNTPVVVAVTFPAGRFATAPRLVANAVTGAPQVILASSATVPTTGGGNVAGVRTSGGVPTTFSVDVIAHYAA